MTKLWRRSLSLFLALVMVMGMLPLNVLADDAEAETGETTVQAQSAETEAPATEAPATEAPMTEPPATQATEPASEPETTEAPRRPRLPPCPWRRSPTMQRLQL